METESGMPIEPQPSWRILPWDSRHFGFPVARIADDLDDDSLSTALESASRQGLRLVYWSTALSRRVDARLLERFGGLLVDWKATYQASPAAWCEADDASGRIVVREYPKGPAAEAVKQLGVAAGCHSRFVADPRIDRVKVVELFEQWMERSTRRLMADTVLVALCEDRVAGVATVAMQDGGARLGLIAVDPALRGQGVGGLLVAAAHRWMLSQGVSTASVVTQRVNGAACRLYEHCGYQVASVEQYYHFWLDQP